MTIEDVRQHGVIRGLFKELVKLEYSFTFEHSAASGPCKAIGLFQVLNLPYPILIKVYLEKGITPVVLLNGKDVSKHSIKELKGLIDEVIAWKRMPVNTVKSKLIESLIDSYISNPDSNSDALKAIVYQAFKTAERVWQPVKREPEVVNLTSSEKQFVHNILGFTIFDKADFKYTKGQDVKLLPSGKVCTFVQYLDTYGSHCVIRVYGSSSGLTTVKLSDIEPWYATPTLFNVDDRVKSLRSQKSGKLVVGPHKTSPGVAWVLFDDEDVPKRVALKYLQKLPVENKLPDWKKGDILRRKGTDEEYTFLYFEGDKKAHITDGRFNGHFLIDELELYTAKRSETAEAGPAVQDTSSVKIDKLPEWEKGDILLRKKDHGELSLYHYAFDCFVSSNTYARVQRLRDGKYISYPVKDMYLLSDTVPNAAQAERKNEGKLEWSLVDFDALEPMVLGLMKGAQKYSPDNWKKGLKCSKIMESLMRHYTAIMRGELIDEETGVPHIGLLMCNAMFFSWTVKNKPELNDLSK